MGDVRALGEFGLIARLREALAGPTDARLVLGIGDDAAAWRTDAGCALATTDTLVAGVHFLPDVVRWRDVGWKALAVNLSDIAAMGGVPSFALVTLCLPPETATAAVDELYAGLRACAVAYGVTVAGGDVVSAPCFSITVALWGEAQMAGGEPRVLRRDAARAGDAIAVTGALGGSAGGLRALREGRAQDPALSPLVERHVRPAPRVESGAAAALAGVRCAIDVSDGLLQDLGHVCAASGLGADLDAAALPIDPALESAYPEDALASATTGGEDYELLLIAPEAVLDAVRARTRTPLHVIGRMVERAGHDVRLLDARGRDIAPRTRGWDHLRGDA
ncbi:MAG TPA: thiamine-phosphate kinase [Dehalococcoidia bacterium]|nr:thiamine-phosphate kinase [Dehalococcoidia bacterium]